VLSSAWTRRCKRKNSAEYGPRSTWTGGPGGDQAKSFPIVLAGQLYITSFRKSERAPSETKPITTPRMPLQRAIVVAVAVIVAAMLKEESRTEFGETLDFHDSLMEGRNT
jgi:hypothetical protein